MPATWVTDGNLCRKNVLFNRWLLPSLVLDLFGTHYEMKIFCRNVHKATKPKEFQTDWYTICGSDIWYPDLQSAFGFWVRAHACLHACMHAFSQEGFEAVMISSCDRGLTACTHTHTRLHTGTLAHMCAQTAANTSYVLEGRLGPGGVVLKGLWGLWVNIQTSTQTHPTAISHHVVEERERERSECKTARKVNTGETDSVDKANLCSLFFAIWSLLYSEWNYRTSVELQMCRSVENWMKNIKIEKKIKPLNNIPEKNL